MDKKNYTSSENTERKRLVDWIKEHKIQLLLSGIGVTAILTTALGLKNKDSVQELLASLKKQLEKGTLYSQKWFENANLDELDKARELVRQDYINPKLDMNYRSECWDLLNKFDNAIAKIKSAGKETGFPVHSSNGWHLPSDD